MGKGRAQQIWRSRNEFSKEIFDQMIFYWERAKRNGFEHFGCFLVGDFRIYSNATVFNNALDYSSIIYIHLNRSRVSLGIIRLQVISSLQVMQRDFRAISLAFALWLCTLSAVGTHLRVLRLETRMLSLFKNSNSWYHHF